jgi:hypothetical protein
MARPEQTGADGLKQPPRRGDGRANEEAEVVSMRRLCIVKATVVARAVADR